MQLKGEFNVSVHGQTLTKALMQESETMLWKWNYSLELPLQSFPLFYEPTACK